MSSSDSHAPHSHMKELTLTFAALIVLTIVTVKVAKIDFGSVAINITIANTMRKSSINRLPRRIDPTEVV